MTKYGVQNGKMKSNFWHTYSFTFKMMANSCGDFDFQFCAFIISDLALFLMTYFA